MEETIAKWVAGGDEDGPASFIGTFYGAQIIAGEEGWEGDFRGEPRVLWLPDENCFRHAFVWKQDNNGMTFVVSPHRLPWLKPSC